jgi:hypothetical protein
MRLPLQCIVRDWFVHTGAGTRAATAAAAAAAAAASDRHSHERQLTTRERDKFEDMLRNLTVRKGSEVYKGL